MREHNDCLLGTLDMLVPRASAPQECMHSCAITLRLQEGSLFPALHRMTQSGRLPAGWSASENNRRARSYSTIPSGRKLFADEAVTCVLRFV